MNAIEAPAPPATTAAAGSPIHFVAGNTYAALPDRFRARVDPAPVASPALIELNGPLARFLGLDPDRIATPEGIEILAGNQIASGSEPLAIAYAGHQFGHFVPQLGDGRANLLGEVVARDGRRYDVQLKGSGPTPFSRRGDGRAALGPVLREYVLSEAMHALGVPTTRALAAVLTGERVFRETVQPGAVLTRVASSHLRVGTFQYFAARGDTDAVRILSDFAIARHYPEAATSIRPYRAFLDGVVARQATLIAQWINLGFIHGVMNTDNTSISGETIDYGPCAFMEAYNPGQVYSSIDQVGRYAYANQPTIALWNLTRLAECLLPLLETEEGSKDTALASAKEALTAFEPQFEAARSAGLLRKLGLLAPQRGDDTLANDLLARMAANRADFTLTFRRLNIAAHDTLAVLFDNPEAFTSWVDAWRNRLQQEPTSAADRAAAMRTANPAYIPRNHLVEAVIRAAVDRDDFRPFHELLEVTSHPFDHQPGREIYATPATAAQQVHATFCGT